MTSKLVRDERGIALISVIIVAAILMALVVGMTALAMNSLDVSRHDQDWNGALSAAEAGIDDYLYRLNRDASYWQYSSTNLPTDNNKAFIQFVNVPGSVGDGEFRYDIDASTVASDGAVKISSTGRVHSTTRTIQATLRRRTFLDYLYFTEYETVDPALYNTAEGYPFDAGTAQTLCARHYYDSPARDSRCSNISFITADTIRGPLHTNDALLISGNPKFQGNTSTSWDDPAGKRWRGSGAPTFVRAGDPAYASPLVMPPSNTSIQAEADKDVGGAGCLYTGPTRITLNSAGTMTVKSPLTNATTLNTGCPLNGTGSLPSNGVVYVQGVPADPTDPNYTAACPTGPSPAAVGKNPLGYPVTGDITPEYGCFDGDAFLSGTLKGELTVASADSIIITGNTTYAGGLNGKDILGLVANNYVTVYHPVKCTTTSGGKCTAWADLGTGTPPTAGSAFFTNPVINAAILSVNHSFIVQNYRRGTPKGTLTVVGAIAQQFRGPVGTFGSGNTVATGYAKDYSYDQKLKYNSPPFFIDAVKSAWHPVTWSEIKPQY